MMNNGIFVLLSLIGPTAAWAQYPQVTAAAQQRADSLMGVWQAQSDSAWAVAWPVVEREARNGRPYRPWASKPDDLPQAPTPCFEGAEGGGMYSFGGRDGRVLTVTNLNDRGPGSLRWACEQGGARTVVFAVGGTIRLSSPISVRAPYISILGQTAPGEGITIAGESFWIDTHDVVVRHLRFRRGPTSVTRRDDCLGGNPVGNIMIDHCSCAFGLDENLSVYRHVFTDAQGQRHKLPTVNVTIQNCISAKALDTWNHAFGSTLGGENCTVVRNLWASNTGRNPSVGWHGMFAFVNNVVFNWRHRTMDGGGAEARFNIIGNYLKPGPATPPTGSVRRRLVKPDRGAQVYARGNVVETGTADGSGGAKKREEGTIEGEAVIVEQPFAMAPVTIMEADAAYDYVLRNAGATLPRRDALDSVIVEEVRTGMISYDAEAEVPPAGAGEVEAESLDGEGHFRYRRMGSDSYRLGIVTDPRQVRLSRPAKP